MWMMPLHLHVNQKSDYDESDYEYMICVDWETHNVVEGDNKLIDLITTYGKPFPLKDSDDNEIVPPTERKYSSHILAYSKTSQK